MKKILIALSCVVSFCNVVKSQDLNFSQYYETPLLRNPALAGIFNGDLRVKLNYRNQWASVAVPFKTIAFSGEYKLPLNNAAGDWVTLGLQAVSDASGDINLKRTSLMPVVCFNKSLSQIDDTYLSVAFIGGPVNTTYDPTAVKTITPTAISSSTYTYYDFGAGLTFNSGFGDDVRYFLGASMYHINNPTLNFYQQNGDLSILGRKLVLSAGITAPTSDNNKVTGYVDYVKQDGAELFLGGLMYGIDFKQPYSDDKVFGLNFGTFFRWGDALIPVVNLDVYDWNFGLSYDVNISKLNTYSQYRGGFEFSATYRAKLNRRTLAGDAMRCPGF